MLGKNCHHYKYRKKAVKDKDANVSVNNKTHIITAPYYEIHT